MEQNLVLKLQQPIDFEGKTYNEIDLSKLENLSATDLGKIESLYQNKYPGEIGIVKEFSSNYYAVIANYITSLPFEMLDLMKIRDFMKMKVLIQNFLFS